VAETIAKQIKHYTIVAVKSTVPVGTSQQVETLMQQHTNVPFDVVNVPEFLKEGSAVKDFFNPDRIVIGVESSRAQEHLQKLYRSVERVGKPLLLTPRRTSELIKYTANAMLACRISFMNELSALCEKTGADIRTVARGIGLDRRIGAQFLQAGVGYGGSCFPKDIKALSYMLKAHHCSSRMVDAIEAVNETQKLSLLPKLETHFPEGLYGRTIALWGLSFKPKTDDVREAPAVSIIQALLKKGAAIRAFDPMATENMRQLFPTLDYAKTPYETLKGCDALLILTEWDEFRNLDLQAVKALLNQPIIIDGRNIYEPAEMKDLGFTYHGVGR